MRGRRLIAIFVGLVGILLLLLVAIVIIAGTGNSDLLSGVPGLSDAGDIVASVVPPIGGDATVTPLPERIEVVVSLQTVPRGWLITEDELTTDERYADEVAANVITNIEDAVGMYAREDIYQGETLTGDALARDPREIGLAYGPSSLIPPGWEAHAIPMDRLSSVGYALAPGDSIDVMLSFVFAQIDEEFQTLLRNSASFVTEVPSEDGPPELAIVIIDPFGRFDTLPQGDLAHIKPFENQRPVPVSMLLQNAKVIHVGPWKPVEPYKPPTPTPDPNAPTPTPGGPPPTPPPPPPDVVVVALPPQQQLFLKYALESNADIDYALRAVQDGQLYAVDPVDLRYILEQFDIEIPPDFNYTLDFKAKNVVVGPDEVTP